MVPGRQVWVAPDTCAALTQPPNSEQESQSGITLEERLRLDLLFFSLQFKHSLHLSGCCLCIGLNLGNLLLCVWSSSACCREMHVRGLEFVWEGWGDRERKSQTDRQTEPESQREEGERGREGEKKGEEEKESERA